MAKRRTIRFTAVTIWLLAALIGVSCRSGGGMTDWGGPAAHDVAVPPGIEASVLTPLTGESLERARMSSEAVIDQLPPAFPEGTDPPQAEVPEPPLAAQHAYVRGRMAWREGDRQEAIAQLEQALRLAPHRAPILRLLGQIYLQVNDRVRGAQYFSQAVKADPTHAPSLFLLGRFVMQQGQWDRGGALILEAMRLGGEGKRRDTAMRRLGHYYLGAAFSKRGYLRAATELYTAYLTDTAPIRGSGGFMREFRLIDRQRHLTLQRVGDLHHQLDEPESAARVYVQVDEMSNRPPPPLGMDLRQVYTHLRLGQVRQAVDRAFTRVRSDHASAATLALVTYLADQGVSSKPLSRELRTIYEKDAQADVSSLAIAMADLADDADARLILQAHLQQHPDDVRVFDRLLSQWLSPQGEGEGGAAAADGRIENAITQTADLMEAYPSEAEIYGLTLLRSSDDLAALVGAFDRLSTSQMNRPTVRVLYGLALAGHGQVDESERAFAEALKQQPDLGIARLQLVKVKIARGEFEAAARLLEMMEDRDDVSVIALRVRVLTETGQSAEALQLLDQMLGEAQGDLSLILQKARLQWVLGDADAAERTLLDTLNQQPTQEALYEALFQIYDQEDAPNRPAIRDADTQYRRLMRRMLGTIPDSRIARLKRAELHVAGRQFGQAIALLSSLVEQNWQDLIATQALLEALHKSGRTDDATALIEKQLKAHDHHSSLLRLVIVFYRRTGNTQRMWALQEQLYSLLPQGDSRLFAIAELYLSTDRAEKAFVMLQRAVDESLTDEPVLLLRLLIDARLQLEQVDQMDGDVAGLIEKYPQHEADLRYLWAFSYTRRGDQASYVRVLIETHEKFPEHASTNNDLGYLWVEASEHLEQALQMIRLAVDAEPQNSAYLDSLGWAYYKLAKFEDAVVWLRKSVEQARVDLRQRKTLSALTTQVVVLDHLGDALYRKGDHADANRTWQQAQRMMNRLQLDPGDTELLLIRQSLTDKIAAHKQQKIVSVASVPQIDD